MVHRTSLTPYKLHIHMHTIYLEMYRLPLFLFTHICLLYFFPSLCLLVSFHSSCVLYKQHRVYFALFFLTFIQSEHLFIIESSVTKWEWITFGNIPVLFSIYYFCGRLLLCCHSWISPTGQACFLPQRCSVSVLPTSVASDKHVSAHTDPPTSAAEPSPAAPGQDGCFNMLPPPPPYPRFC